MIYFEFNRSFHTFKFDFENFFSFVNSDCVFSFIIFVETFSFINFVWFSTIVKKWFFFTNFIAFLIHFMSLLIFCISFCDISNEYCVHWLFDIFNAFNHVSRREWNVTILFIHFAKFVLFNKWIVSISNIRSENSKRSIRTLTFFRFS